MNTFSRFAIAGTSLIGLGQSALAQSTINRYVMASGGVINSFTASGTLYLSATIGQNVCGPTSSTTHAMQTGFWIGAAPAACYANCDGSTTAPILTANDFQCFLNAFAASQSYANCDASTTLPVLTANDFQCFLNSFAAGCS